MQTDDVIGEVAKACGQTKVEVRAVFGALGAVIAHLLCTEKEVRIRQLGKFTVKNRPARKGRNPRTGEQIDVAASMTIKFAPSSDMKKQVQATPSANSPASEPENATQALPTATQSA